MGMAAILFNGAELFEQIVKIPSTEGSMKKMGQAATEKMMCKKFIILYLYRCHIGCVWGGGGWW